MSVKIPALTFEVLVRVKGSEEIHEVGEIEVPFRVTPTPASGPFGHAPGVRSAGASARSAGVSVQIDEREFRGNVRAFGEEFAEVLTENVGFDSGRPATDAEVAKAAAGLGQDTDPEATAAAHAARPLGGTVRDAERAEREDRARAASAARIAARKA